MENRTTQLRGLGNAELQHAILSNDTRIEHSTDTYSEEFFTDDFKDFNWQPARAERVIDKIKKAARSLNRFFDTEFK